jgi:hypothetical protein
VIGNACRLDSMSTSLATALRQAVASKRCVATSIACSNAVSAVGLRGEEVDAAIAILNEGGIGSGSLRHKLEMLSAEFDDAYFRLKGETREMPPPALLLFRKARAAAALAFAVSADPTHQLEAVYEAISASDDEERAILLVNAALMDGRDCD